MVSRFDDAAEPFLKAYREEHERSEADLADERWYDEHPIRSLVQPPPWRSHRGPRRRRPSSIEVVAGIMLAIAIVCVGLALYMARIGLQ